MEAYERETTVTFNDAEPVVRIYSAQRQVITALRKKPQFREVGSGYFEGAEWVQFEVDVEHFSLARAIRTQRILSDEQRAKLSARARVVFGDGTNTRPSPDSSDSSRPTAAEAEK